jgi:peptide/nickel transport system permease protein
MAEPMTVRPGFWRRLLDGDLAYRFRQSPVAIVSALVAAIIILGAVFADFVAPHNPFDLSTVSLLDALDPPAWMEGGNAEFPLGTDSQGRDMLSAILFGSRISLMVGALAVGFAMTIGIAAGLLAGWRGGWADALIMRLADVQLSFPSILVALLIDGIARALLPREVQDQIAIWVLVVSIGLSGWVQFARTVRGSTLVERNKEYIQAARIIGVHPVRIVIGHVLPNVLTPVLVIATIYLANAIITEATLSFLGVGVPVTQPSLGTLIRVGNSFLFSGEWWITLFPSITLAALILSVNLLGDWVRDALNPRLR